MAIITYTNPFRAFVIHASMEGGLSGIALALLNVINSRRSRQDVSKSASKTLLNKANLATDWSKARQHKPRSKHKHPLKHFLLLNQHNVKTDLRDLKNNAICDTKTYRFGQKCKMWWYHRYWTIMWKWHDYNINMFLWNPTKHEMYLLLWHCFNRPSSQVIFNVAVSKNAYNLC